MFVFVYVKSKDFHTEDRNRVVLAPFLKATKFPPLELCPQMKKRAFTAPSDPNPVNTCTCT